MDYIVANGQTIYGAKDMFGKNLNVLKPDWIKDISEDIVYVPIGMLGSLPVKFSYKILIILFILKIYISFQLVLQLRSNQKFLQLFFYHF